jgi:hypothetical protein
MQLTLYAVNKIQRDFLVKIEVLTAVFLKIQESLDVKLRRLVPDVSSERSAFETWGTTQPRTER